MCRLLWDFERDAAHGGFSFLEKHILTLMVETSHLSRWSLDVVLGDDVLTNHGISVDGSEGAMGVAYH